MINLYRVVDNLISLAENKYEQLQEIYLLTQQQTNTIEESDIELLDELIEKKQEKIELIRGFDSQFQAITNDIKTIFVGVLKNKILATVFELMVIGAVFFFFANEPIQEFNNYTVLRYPIIILFIIVFAFSFGIVTKILSLKIFQKLGDLSIAIYMTHGFVLYFTQMIETSYISVHVLATFIFTLLFAYILVQYYCPYCKKLILRLFSF